ncbi:MAG: DUF3604 domain-containing protein, partial [Proteobacteria bacterium]|nr:DUF3604 domain-containing protein [Pseudomonadota bacterium]
MKASPVTVARAVAPVIVLLLLQGCSRPTAPQTAGGEQGPDVAAPKAAQTGKAGFSPYAARSYPTRVYWGDQHLHTSWSPDAVGAGTRVGPEEALRFARGEEIVSSTGIPVRLARPLDWLAVSDHSDAMGIMSEVIAGNPKLMTDPVLKRWNKQMNADAQQAYAAVLEGIALQGKGQLPTPMKDPAVALDMWHKMTTVMERYNDPGLFMAFIAYEWTSNYGGGNNLHRNVIYRDGKALADQLSPLTTFVSENPEDLWKWMQSYEQRTGGKL